MISESEAKQRWCPFAQSATTVAVPMGDGKKHTTLLSTTRVSNAQQAPNLCCIGKHCMMWVESSIITSDKEKRGDCAIASLSRVVAQMKAS